MKKFQMLGGHNSRQRPSVTRVEQLQNEPRSVSNAHKQLFLQKVLRERVRESVVALIIGVALVLCGTALLFWNEGEAVYISKTLDEGFSSVVQVQSPDLIDPKHDNKLVHVSGALGIVTPLQNSYFGIKVRAVALKRRVQTYQWIEEESAFSSREHIEERHDEPNSPYFYSQTWKDKLVDSSNFDVSKGHENPKSPPLAASVQTAETVIIGSYHLSPAIKAKLDKFFPFSGDEQPDTDEVKLHNGMYYFTKDIFNPNVGDIRVQFYFSGHEGEVVTIIGKQVGNTLRPYVTSSGKELLILREGKLSVEEMFSFEHAQNRFLTWFNRLCGWLLIFMGMTSISAIIQYFAALSPLLRDVIVLGLGSASVTLSVSLSLILIGCAWSFYRPGVALLIISVAAMPLIRAAFQRHGGPSEVQPIFTSQLARV